MKGIIINENNILLPPGTAVYVGDQPASEMDISVVVYDQSSAEKKDIATIDELQGFKSDLKTWVNITGLKDIESIKKLATNFSIHPLTVEDILNTKQQPKVEKFDNYLFISLKSIQHEKTYHQPQSRKKTAASLQKERKFKKMESIEEYKINQISIIIMKGLLISFQEAAGHPFDNIRMRILENIGRVRRMGTGYLGYVLIDAVVDEYYLALAHLEDEIERYEDRAIKTSDDTFIMEIQGTKKDLLHIKRAMLPLRENIMAISHDTVPAINENIKPFLQDLRENLNNAIESVENYRDWLSNIMDVNLSFLSYQLNKVMKILAMVSSTFIPLTFIAGVYGMNFHNMPELDKSWGYPVVLGCMGLIAVLMVIFFKKRRWF